MIPVTPDRALAALLEWYLAVGVDEAIGDTPADRFRLPEPPSAAEGPAARSPEGRPVGYRPASPGPQGDFPARPPLPGPARAPSAAAAGAGGRRNPVVPVFSADRALAEASAAAESAATLDELIDAVRNFEGCALRATAGRAVILDGPPGAPVLVIGQAPDEAEDMGAGPGPAGRLLDRMMGSIGLSRKNNFCVSNMVFWRPPGDRRPTAQEVSVCLPFVRRLIGFLAPKVILLTGATAAETLLARPEGIVRLRGHWLDYRCEISGQIIPTLATYHPAYLLGSPLQKRDAWKDLMMMQERLESLDFLPKRHEN
jgi:DNA polymerase